jgi:hypothetical protein
VWQGGVSVENLLSPLLPVSEAVLCMEEVLPVLAVVLLCSEVLPALSLVLRVAGFLVLRRFKVELRRQALLSRERRWC